MHRLVVSPPVCLPHFLLLQSGGAFLNSRAGDMHQAKLNWRGPVTRDIDIHGVHAGHLVSSSRELGRKCRVMQISSDEEAPGTARRPWNQTRSECVRPVEACQFVVIPVCLFTEEGLRDQKHHEYVNSRMRTFFFFLRSSSLSEHFLRNNHFYIFFFLDVAPNNKRTHKS